MQDSYYVLLAGGVGAAKFIEGLVKVVEPESLKIIVNTADDLELFGLKICPDIDIITYTLAGIIDTEKGWGYRGDTFNCLNILKNFYDTGWFNAGDKDLAIHIYRTDLLNHGYSKSEVTRKICEKLGVKSQLFPMCNEPVGTYIKTPKGFIHFEEYYIKYNCELEVFDIKFKGIEKAKPIGGVVKYIENAKKIIICPSNPIVSIGTILNVKGIKSTLCKVKNKVYAISPIIEGATVKGPADKLMHFLNLEVSCVGVAKYYKNFLGHFIIDIKDDKLKAEIERLGIKTYCYDTIMTNLSKKKELAQFLVQL